MSTLKWDRRVSPSGPSVLHEYAVGVIWDLLHGHEPVQLKTIDGKTTDDLRVEGGQVFIPNEIATVQSMIPDLAIRNEIGEIVRIIEIVTTNPPDEEKKRRYDALRKQGWML